MTAGAAGAGAAGGGPGVTAGAAGAGAAGGGPGVTAGDGGRGGSGRGEPLTVCVQMQVYGLEALSPMSDWANVRGTLLAGHVAESDRRRGARRR